MGFRKDWDLNSIKHAIWKMGVEIRSPHNDGWTASSCKHDLYQLKCLIDDLYNDLPKFAGEEEWEQERLVQLLKKK